VCAGNQRLLMDADSLLAFTQYIITRDEWIAPYVFSDLRKQGPPKGHLKWLSPFRQSKF
jgi:hypothetical protein